MEQTIQIQEIIHKVAKESGKPWQQIQTDKGTMTCHDTLILTKLQEAKQNNKTVIVETAESIDGKYTNIREFKSYGLGIEKTAQPTSGFPALTVKPQQAFTPSNNKNTTMYTSYAKDIFTVLRPTEKETLKDVMQIAINLVKQAKTAFE